MYLAPTLVLIAFWEEFIKNKMADGEHFKQMAPKKAFVSDILLTIGYIAFKFDVLVLRVFLMI